MTIENELGRIATALEKIAAGTGNQLQLPLPTAATPVVAATTSVVAATTSTGKPRGRPRKDAAPPPAAEDPTPGAAEELEPETDAFNDPDEGTAGPTVDDVRAALVAYQQRVGSQVKARELLKTVGGVDNLKALSPAKYAKVIAAAKK